jgi:diguanylate cyclase (GGDEF)-like protein
MAAAERIRHCVEALAIAHAGNPAGHVTISVGVAALVPLNQNEAATRLVAAADRALYAAKAGGRNQVRQAEQFEDAVDVVVAAGSD